MWALTTLPENESPNDSVANDQRSNANLQVNTQLKREIARLKMSKDKLVWTQSGNNSDKTFYIAALMLVT